MLDRPHSRIDRQLTYLRKRVISPSSALSAALPSVGTGHCGLLMRPGCLGHSVRGVLIVWKGRNGLIDVLLPFVSENLDYHDVRQPMTSSSYKQLYAGKCEKSSVSR